VTKAFGSKQGLFFCKSGTCKQIDKTTRHTKQKTNRKSSKQAWKQTTTQTNQT